MFYLLLSTMFTIFIKIINCILEQTIYEKTIIIRLVGCKYAYWLR